MEVKIYNYANWEITVDIPNRSIDDIERMSVSIMSGDEIVQIVFNNQQIIYLDAGMGARVKDFCDGFYILDTKEEIEKWFNFDFSTVTDEAYSYGRYMRFMQTE